MFKDIALNYLAASHLFPKKAADVQAHAEAVLGRSFHRRTAGRTLYRLSKKFEVVRRSQSWFSILRRNAAWVFKRISSYPSFYLALRMSD